MGNEVAGIGSIINVIMSFLGVRSITDVLKSIVDISIVAYVVYRAIVLVRDTRAIQLVKGILFILVAMYVSKWLGLHTVEFLLTNSIQLIGFTLVVIFQPELRRGLEQIGRSKVTDLFNIDKNGEGVAIVNVIEEITRACTEMSKNYTGALIVVVRNTYLGEIAVNGIEIDSKVSNDLLINIFTPNTPLHDGAVVIEGNRIKAAACILPLTDNAEVDRSLGTRHRAAIGVTEVSDAIAVVISEETGKISLAENGKITRNISPDTLRKDLYRNLLSASSDKHTMNTFWKVRNWYGQGKNIKNAKK